jgi:hypothetical protein
MSNRYISMASKRLFLALAIAGCTLSVRAEDPTAVVAAPAKSSLDFKVAPAVHPNPPLPEDFYQESAKEQTPPIEPLSDSQGNDLNSEQSIAVPTSNANLETLDLAPIAPAKPSKAPEVPKPHKPLFYDNDFSYLEKPNNQFFYYGDSFKRIPVGDCWTMDVGGEYRARYHHESNLRGSDLSGRSDSFLLHRTRVYGNAEYGDFIRLYAEGIDATSEFENFPPRTIEENRFDALNLFGDVKLLDNGDGKWRMRVGRQELLYGDQRLISPLDWANTRRTFDGAKIFYKTKDWALDGFWTRPVPFSQHVNSDSNFDSSDDSQEFAGIYASHKVGKDEVRDFYFLRFAEYQGPGTAVAPTDYDPMMFGGRWNWKDGSLLFDLEGGYQFGNWGAEEISAGFVTVGLGRENTCACWKPKYWVYYDYASGDRDPTDGTHQTFFQYFPLVHKYFGYADLIARQNIHDFNFLYSATPSKQTEIKLWHHIFWLDSARDGLYNANGARIRFDPTGTSGDYVGQETDFTWQYNFGPRSNVLFGYSHFWSGDYVRNTTAPGIGLDVDFFYTQYTVQF